MKVFRIKPGKEMNPFCEKEIKDFIDYLAEAEPGDIITIKVLEMTENEYNQLPEYVGP